MIPDPLCMTPEELAGWLELAIYSPARDGTPHDPCMDCLLPFAREMMAAGRCNGMPGYHRHADARSDGVVALKARLTWWRAKLRDMGLDPEHARVVA